MSKLNFTYIIGLFLCSVFFILLFSTSTTPLYENYGIDSGVFQVIGKEWANGKLPYIDVWDQKGPFIFFINMIGYSISGNAIGIFLIQIVALFLSLIATFKTCQLYTTNGKSLLLCSLFLAWLLRTYSCGNMTEEYCLPFLCFSFYGVVKWLKQTGEGTYSHSGIFAFVYGMAFAVSLLTRLTNAIGVSFAVFFIFIVLLIHKEWKNIGVNILAFLAGVALFMIPCICYFAAHDALYEMWYGTILFNLEYAESSVPTASLKGWLVDLLKQWPCTVLVIASILLYVKNKSERTTALLFLLVGIMTFLYLHNSRGYEHYTQISTPYIVISILLLSLTGLSKKIKIGASCLIYGVALLIGVKSAMLMRSYAVSDVDRVNRASRILSVVPQNERDRILCWDCDPFIYLKNDICPSMRFFCFQNSQIVAGPSVEELMLSDFSMRKPLWVLVSGNESPKGIDAKLSKDYELNIKENGYTLYKLKE